ncbi:MAG: flagellar type III secretion system protein FlhB [Leptospiraceae bacterium]|nr:flagellar type III secretion system protein FlhB [Leptospiraceae bacterium]MCK6380402.1 flagellar type III secretion system protein FlhB [Leptospiraceae bacterium]NUM42491.1 flagellar type III secretion system protein FlhB [Leptospiraceae bacterium]
MSLDQVISENDPDLKYWIRLQLFAAEDEGRTEEASERTRREEREKGNVPKSNEIPSALVMIAGVVLIFFLSKYLFFRFSFMVKKYFHGIAKNNEFGAEALIALSRSVAEEISYLLLPILGITFITAIIGNVVQVGFLFSPRALRFDLARVSPNFKKVLPTRQTLFNLGKSILKIILIGWVSYIIISFDFLPVLMTGDMGVIQSTGMIAYTSLKIFLVCGIILFVISIVDFFYQKFEFEESLKMTPAEAKREMKQEEGDKAILQKRRQRMRDMIQSGMLQKVKTADVVITNPTHYAVALVYEPGVQLAPVVIAKGMDEIALIIRRIARENNVPIVENRVQARMLYEEVELNQPIPEKFFHAVSVIITKLDKYKRLRA